MNKISQKTNMSSLQVLKTLMLLLQGDYSMQELIYKLNENEKQPDFNNSVISKYINTCRYAGINIVKLQNKYFVANLPFGFNFDIAEIKILQMFQEVIAKGMSSRQLKTFNEFLAKIEKYSNKEIVRVDKKEWIMSFELFAKAIAKKRKVKLSFKNRNVLECIPISISEEAGKVFFNVYNKKIRNIDISRLAGIELLDKEYSEVFDNNQTVVYKLTGGLAKRYEPREHETIQVCADGSVLITNKNENKDLLLSRLIRYQDMCEILRPISYRKEFKQILDDTLANYGI